MIIFNRKLVRCWELLLEDCPTKSLLFSDWLCSKFPLRLIIFLFFLSSPVRIHVHLKGSFFQNVQIQSFVCCFASGQFNLIVQSKHIPILFKVWLWALPHLLIPKESIDLSHQQLMYCFLNGWSRKLEEVCEFWRLAKLKQTRLWRVFSKRVFIICSLWLGSRHGCLWSKLH